MRLQAFSLPAPAYPSVKNVSFSGLILSFNTQKRPINQRHKFRGYLCVTMQQSHRNSGWGKQVGNCGKKALKRRWSRFYLMTSPHANMLGLYYLPILYIAHETGLGLEGASKGLKSTIEAGFCSYDEDTEMVWVHEMAAYQVGKALKPGDNRCAGVRSEYASLTENPFLSLFYERYKDDFHLNVKRESCPTPEGASKGFEAKIRNRNRIRNKNKIKIFRGMAPPPPDGGSSDEAPSEKPKSSYPEEFELAWREYPKRAGRQ